MLEKKILKDRNEWLNHREKLGGSDAAAVLGLKKEEPEANTIAKNDI